MTVVGRIVCILAAATTLAAQAKTPSPAEVATVCEVLGNPAEYNGKTIAVLGRSDCAVDFIDASCFLAEDHCSHPLVTYRQRWPNKIWLQLVSVDGTHVSNGKLTIDKSVVAKKLAVVRRTTKLGCHTEIGMDARTNKPVSFSQADEWGLAYGRVVFRPKLKPGENCSGSEEGCGGWNETSVMLLVEVPTGDNFVNFPDGAYPGNWKLLTCN